MTTDIDNNTQFSSAMATSTGDYATAAHHTRSQGMPPIYTETDSNESIPVHQDLQNNGKPRHIAMSTGCECADRPTGK